MQKDTRWNSEREALLFVPERNELNGMKMNISTPKEQFPDLDHFFFTDYWFQVNLNFRGAPLSPS